QARRQLDPRRGEAALAEVAHARVVDRLVPADLRDEGDAVPLERQRDPRLEHQPVTAIGERLSLLEHAVVLGAAGRCKVVAGWIARPDGRARAALAARLTGDRIGKRVDT